MSLPNGNKSLSPIISILYKMHQAFSQRVPILMACLMISGGINVELALDIFEREQSNIFVAINHSIELCGNEESGNRWEWVKVGRIMFAARLHPK